MVALQPCTPTMMQDLHSHLRLLREQHGHRTQGQQAAARLLADA